MSEVQNLHLDFCAPLQTAPGGRSAESFKAMLAAGSPRQSGSPALRLNSVAPLKPRQGLPSLLCRLPGHNDVSRTEYRWSKARERTDSHSTHRQHGGIRPEQRNLYLLKCEAAYLDWACSW